MNKPRNVVNGNGETSISFKHIATITQTLLTRIHSFILLGVIESQGSMLKLEDIRRIIFITRLRRDLGLNPIMQQ